VFCSGSDIEARTHLPLCYCDVRSHVLPSKDSATRTRKSSQSGWGLRANHSFISLLHCRCQIPFERILSAFHACCATLHTRARTNTAKSARANSSTLATTTQNRSNRAMANIEQVAPVYVKSCMHQCCGYGSGARGIMQRWISATPSTTPLDRQSVAATCDGRRTIHNCVFVDPSVHHVGKIGAPSRHGSIAPHCICQLRRVPAGECQQSLHASTFRCWKALHAHSSAPLRMYDGHSDFTRHALGTMGVPRAARATNAACATHAACNLA
jgi:hypothetical protein